MGDFIINGELPDSQMLTPIPSKEEDHGIGQEAALSNYISL